MHLRRITLLLFLILLGAAHGLAADRSVHVATLNWEPYIGERLDANGFGAAILREAFRRAGYETTFTFMPWVRALKEAEIGKYDAVGFAYHSTEREKKYIFSAAYAESVLGFAKLRKSDVKFATLQDLAPYRIGVVRGFVNTPEFDALESLHKEAVKNELMNLKKLVNGRVDLILIDKFIMRHLMRKHFPGQIDAVEFLDPPLAVHPLYLMFSRKHTYSETRVRAFNAAIEAMQRDGTTATIMKHFGYVHAD